MTIKWFIVWLRETMPVMFRIFCVVTERTPNDEFNFKYGLQRNS